MSSRKFMALFLLCALLPLAAAWLALEQGWFAGHATNRGQWLDHEVQVLPAAPAADAHWRLAYVQPRDCDAACEAAAEVALHILQQLHAGLGRKQEQVRPVVVATASPTVLERFPSVRWEAGAAGAGGQVAALADAALTRHIVIVNREGLALLRYAVDGDRAHAVQVATDIRSDLLRLLNYDRSGV